jgi:ATP-dependent helicase Lhr and Lhr-like helicase
VARLRSIRRSAGRGQMVSVSGADPLNLIGILTPGDRLTSLTKNRVLYEDGVPIAVHEGGAAKFLVELEPNEKWRAEQALLRRRVAPRLRAYLGKGS